MKNVLTTEAFAEFCERKPAGEKYNWDNGDFCACGQYAASLGLTAREWSRKACFGGFWVFANAAAFTKPHTFGALAARLRGA